MIIDNGKRVRLQITGVFDGEAGLSRGRVAFLPNMAQKRPEEALGALLDGVPVRIEVVREASGPLYSAAVHTL